MSDTLPSRIVPSAIGFIASLGSMGAALLPWIAGNLAQHYGMWVLLPYVIALTAIMLVLLRSPKILLEQQIQQSFREVRIIVNVLVEFEVAVNHIFPPKDQSQSPRGS